MMSKGLLNAYNGSSFFSENLIKLRKNKGFTQQQVASKLGIDRTTYTKYETGVSEPGFEMLIRLSQMLNVSLDELFGGPVNDPLTAAVSDSRTESLSEYELELIAAYRGLNEDEKRRLKENLANKTDSE